MGFLPALPTNFHPMSTSFPFSAIVGQDEMKLAILIAAVDPSIGGVLVFGDRGTGKSTAIRALAALLPKMRSVANCRYGCDSHKLDSLCEECRARKLDGTLKSCLIPVPVVDLPLGATEDRVVGALDLERALSQGVKAFEPGLLARANRGFLYIDEVNLLEDHLVDLLIDVASSGENVVERDGLSVRHPARFVLVGSGNPEEGELRPQLLDRFGLSVEVKTPDDLPTRVEVVRRRDTFERDPAAFVHDWKKEDERIRRRIVRGRRLLPLVDVPQAARLRAAELCKALGTDGLRGDLTLIRAARACAALQGDTALNDGHLRQVAASALRHRLRRNPLDDAGSTVRVERAVTELFGV
jgi:magnesium chelatase subunit I